VKPSWGARASICAAVTDDEDADGLTDGAVGVPALLIAGVTDGDDELTDRAVGVPALLFVGAGDDDSDDGLVGGAG